MAVLLNEVFFPKYAPHTTSILVAATFCSTYVMRPVGALIFGWIGDHIGRKPTIVITTAMMAFSCIVMANLSTYAQIGITAAWIMIFCRIVQGISSMGEVMGAEVYLTETIQRPARYPATAFLEVSAGLGALLALGTGFLLPLPVSIGVLPFGSEQPLLLWGRLLEPTFGKHLNSLKQKGNG